MLEARPVERLDADRVAGDDAVTAGVGHRQGEHAPQLVQGGRAVAQHEPERGLGVGVGAEADLREGPADVLVVVDLPVADHVGGFRVVGDRLLAARHVHDRQTLVAQPGRVELDPSRVVGPPVVESGEHPLALVGVDLAVSRNDSAHGVSRILDWGSVIRDNHGRGVRGSRSSSASRDRHPVPPARRPRSPVPQRQAKTGCSSSSTRVARPCRATSRNCSSTAAVGAWTRCPTSGIWTTGRSDSGIVR